MNDRTFKVSHWHIITWIHFIFSDDSFGRLPCITLVQHQVKRTLRWLWGMSLTRSFSWRGKILRLDRWNGLDGCHVNHWAVQNYHWRSELWDLGKRGLAGLLLLETSMTWKVTEVRQARYRLPLPCLDGRFLYDWRGSVVLNLDVLTTTCSLFLVFLHGSHSYDEENKIKKKKKKKFKRKMDDTYFDG